VCAAAVGRPSGVSQIPSRRANSNFLLPNKECQRLGYLSATAAAAHYIRDVNGEIARE
jgi:hypothetical protein